MLATNIKATDTYMKQDEGNTQAHIHALSLFFFYFVRSWTEREQKVCRTECDSHEMISVTAAVANKGRDSISFMNAPSLSLSLALSHTHTHTK